MRATVTPEGLVAVSAPESRLFSLRGFANKNGDYHVSDFALFWMDVRDNAELRLAQWLTQRQSQGVKAATRPQAKL